jgi:uncharacterized protein YlzI (FlbEa/FlbD family)
MPETVPESPDPLFYFKVISYLCDMIQLTLTNTRSIYVNPKHIVSIEPSEVGSTKSRIYLVNRDFYVVESPDEIMFRINNK